MENQKKCNASNLSKRIISLAGTRGMTVSGAESCTGGLIAKLLTDVPGSSSVFCGACVTYTNEIKMKLLGVPQFIIEQYTEVSHPCAEEMARGARSTMQTDIAYSTTGYAGPGGGTETDPVGTVYVGIATREGVQSYRLSLPQTATRRQIRQATAIFVLQKILEAAGG